MNIFPGFAGSKSILENDRKVNIIAIIMEWYFNGLNGLGNFPPSCPENKLKELTKLLISTNYTPYRIDHVTKKVMKMDTSMSTLGTDWVLLDILWLHEASMKNASFLRDEDIVQPGYYTESILSKRLRVSTVQFHNHLSNFLDT